MYIVVQYDLSVSIIYAEQPVIRSFQATFNTADARQLERGKAV